MPRVVFSFEFPIGVAALDEQTITFADVADLANLRLIAFGGVEMSFVEGILTDGTDSFATTSIVGNVVTLHVTVAGGPNFTGYTWAE